MAFKLQLPSHWDCFKVLSLERRRGREEVKSERRVEDELLE